MSELPDGWAYTTLGEVCSKPQYGHTSAATRTGRVKYVRTTDISGGEIDWSSVPFCLQEPTDLEKYRVRSDDILVSRAGSVGISTRVDACPHEAVFASYLIRFCTSDGVLPKYVEFFLKSDGYWRSISESSAGIAVPNVNASKLSEIPLPLAPTNEQVRMVARLGSVLNNLAACQQRLERIPILLKRFRQSVLAAACSGRLTEDWRDAQRPTKSSGSAYSTDGVSQFPESWQIKDLRSLCRAFKYGTSAKSAKQGKVPVLRMGNIQEGRIDWSDLVYTSEEAEIRKYRLEPKSVLFNRTNSPELVGKTAIYLGERPAIFAGYLILIEPDKDQLLPEFLNFCLNSPDAKEYCLSVKSDGVSQSNINAQKIAAFVIGRPPIDEQHEIIKRVENLFVLADQIEARYQRAKAQVDKLTPAILAKAFRGELVPQDPNEEPADKLLERIRAARGVKQESKVASKEGKSARPKPRKKIALTKK